MYILIMTTIIQNGRTFLILLSLHESSCRSLWPMPLHHQIPWCFPKNHFSLINFKIPWLFPVKIKTIVYLYGTWGACSTSAFITRPRVRRLWLMLPASLALLSTAPDRPMFSDPAKSTCTGQKLSKLTLFHYFIHKVPSVTY